MIRNYVLYIFVTHKPSIRVHNVNKLYIYNKLSYVQSNTNICHSVRVCIAGSTDSHIIWLLIAYPLPFYCLLLSPSSLWSVIWSSTTLCCYCPPIKYANAQYASENGRHECAHISEHREKLLIFLLKKKNRSSLSVLHFTNKLFCVMCWNNISSSYP